jgi:hypothetical protein
VSTDTSTIRTVNDRSRGTRVGDRVAAFIPKA